MIALSLRPKPHPRKARDAEGCGDVERGFRAHEGNFDAAAAAVAKHLLRDAEFFRAEHHDAR
jgi:hypothetical protein